LELTAFRISSFFSVARLWQRSGAFGPMLPAMPGTGLGLPDQNCRFFALFLPVSCGYPKKAVAETTVKTAENYVKDHSDTFKEMVFVQFGQKSDTVLRKALKRRFTRKRRGLWHLVCIFRDKAYNK
jgi:hypothetical protein